MLRYGIYIVNLTESNEQQPLSILYMLRMGCDDIVCALVYKAIYITKTFGLNLVLAIINRHNIKKRIYTNNNNITFND